MNLALLVIGVLNLVLLAVLLAIRGRTGAELQDLRADMAERLARSAADTQREISERVSAALADARREHEAKLGVLQTVVQRELQTGRAEVSALVTHGLAESRQEQESRLAAVQAAVQEELHRGRLDVSGQLAGLVTAQTNALTSFQEGMEKRFEQIRERTDQRLAEIGQQVQVKLDQNIHEGFRHFEEVQKSLRATEEQLLGLKTVGSSITELNNLLKLPHLRGGFGEATLERLLADFLPASMFELQVPIGSAQDRVDAVIHFPDHMLPIDSKFPREQVLELFSAADDAQLVEARKVLSRVVREQARSITKYIKPEAGTTDIALMFLPSETLYFEVLRDVDLWASLMKIKVFPVSPNTLAVTLQAIGLAYKSYQMRQNVDAILEQMQKTRKHFAQFQVRFEDVGENLEKAQKAFNTAGTHLRNYSASVDRLTGETGGEQLALPAPLPGAAAGA